MKPIYEPAGRAREYSEDGDSNLALNIYDGCPHGCLYCYVPLVLKCDRAQFHAHCEPRPGIVEATRKQLEKGVLISRRKMVNVSTWETDIVKSTIQLTGKSVFLCFTCDPFPADVSHEPTYQIIELLKSYGNSVQILTKNYPDDIDRICTLLDENDRYGVSFIKDTRERTVYEPNAPDYTERCARQTLIKEVTGCKTFMSCEPVVDTKSVYEAITWLSGIDQFRIGKLNYEWLLPPDLRPDIEWGAFGREAERLCKEYGRGYLIKEDLRREMDSTNIK